MAGVTYEAHLEFLIKQEMGARAERYGFVDAKLCVAVPLPFDSEYETMRYQQGYEDGKAIFEIEGGQP
jgi:uncharacterized membrane protein